MWKGGRAVDVVNGVMVVVRMVRRERVVGRCIVMVVVVVVVVQVDGVWWEMDFLDGGWNMGCESLRSVDFFIYFQHILELHFSNMAHRESHTAL